MDNLVYYKLGMKTAFHPSSHLSSRVRVGKTFIAAATAKQVVPVPAGSEVSRPVAPVGDQ
jgi:uncharacterized protein (DUF111 family)